MDLSCNLHFWLKVLWAADHGYSFVVDLFPSSVDQFPAFVALSPTQVDSSVYRYTHSCIHTYVHMYVYMCMYIHMQYIHRQVTHTHVLTCMCIWLFILYLLG